MLISLLFLATCQNQLAGQRAQRSARQPAALLAAEKHRAFINARVKWVSHSVTDGGHSEIRGLAQYTKNENLFVNDFGLVPSNEGRQPLILKTLFYGKQYWDNHNESALSVRVRDERKQRYFDIRALGMRASSKFPKSVADALWRPFSVDRPQSYEVVRQGRYHVVTAYIVGEVPGVDGQLAHKWWIDPSRGWSVVRCQRLLNGEVQREVRSNLRDYDGIWFPESLAFFDGKSDAGRRPYATVTIEEARFNDARLPARLSPADIGVEVGTNVTYLESNGVSTLYGWDGEKIGPFRSIAGKITRGEIQLGPRVRTQRREAMASAVARADAQGPASSLVQLGVPNPAPQVSEWEKYVRRFIHAYNLDAAQIQSAWRIHRDSKERADRYLASRKHEFEDFRRRQLEAKKVPDTRDKRILLRDLAEARALLLRPVVEIFDSSLKPRLERLPTRKQRAEAAAKGVPEPSPSSKP